MLSERHQKLLEATGYTWQVAVYKDANRRRLLRVRYIRAASRMRAEAVAIQITDGAKCASAWPWDPSKDSDRCISTREAGE